VGRQHAQADDDEEAERANVTLLISGLTAAQDFLVEGALRGLGYNVEYFGMADNAGLQVGKEFGNRGPVQPDLLHGRLAGEAPHRPARQEGMTPRRS
jgi:hypothetical protein